MSADRWEPFREAVSLRDAMNSLLQESFVRPLGTVAAGLQGGHVALDVEETAEEFVIEASLPGFRPEEVQVTVQGDVLTIRAERPEAEGSKPRAFLLHERRTGPLHRSITLTAPVDSEKAAAHFDLGILRLTLPKAAVARPRQIRIGGGPP